MKQLPAVSVEHEVAWMAIAEAQEIPDHGHHGSTARVGRAAIQPDFAVATLQPQDLEREVT